MSIFVSDSPYGPWTQQMPWVVAGSGTQEIDGVPWAKGARYVGGNPTALILENGTTLVFFRGGGGNYSTATLATGGALRIAGADLKTAGIAS